MHLKRSAVWQRRKVLKQYMPLVAKMKEYDEDRYGHLIVELLTDDNKRSMQPLSVQALHGGTSITLLIVLRITVSGRCSKGHAWLMG